MFSPDRFLSERRQLTNTVSPRLRSTSESVSTLRNNPNAFNQPNPDTSRPVIPLRTCFRVNQPSGTFGSKPIPPIRQKGKFAGRKAQSDPATPCVLKDRGLRPSDLSDPHKKAFLTDLTTRVFHLALVSKKDGV